jgi:hypothetical protein
MATKELILVSKLTKETQEGKIKWEIIGSPPTSLSQSERLIDYPYKATVREKVFRIFKYESKYFIDDERYEWTQGVRLEMLHHNSDRSSYTFPEVVNLRGLYDEIRRQVAGIDNFLDNYLAGENDPEPEGF